MLVTSQLPIQSTKFAIIYFQRALVPPHFEKRAEKFENHWARLSHINEKDLIYAKSQQNVSWE